MLRHDYLCVLDQSVGSSRWAEVRSSWVLFLNISQVPFSFDLLCLCGTVLSELLSPDSSHCCSLQPGVRFSSAGRAAVRLSFLPLIRVHSQSLSDVYVISPEFSLKPRNCFCLYMYIVDSPQNSSIYQDFPLRARRGRVEHRIRLSQRGRRQNRGIQRKGEVIASRELNVFVEVVAFEMDRSMGVILAKRWRSGYSNAQRTAWWAKKSRLELPWPVPRIVHLGHSREGMQGGLHSAGSFPQEFFWTPDSMT